MRITGGDLRGRTLHAPDGLDTRPTSDRVRQALFNILLHHDWGAALGQAVRGKIVLDAFAGTGALGIEALSHGAARALFFEKEKKALTALKSNIATMKLESTTQILPLDVRRAPRLESTETNNHPPLAGGSKLRSNFGEGSTDIETKTNFDLNTSKPLPENTSCFRPSRKGRVICSDLSPIQQQASLIFFDPPYRKGLTEEALAHLSAQGWIAPQALLVCETAKDETLALPENCTPLLTRAYGLTEVHFWQWLETQ